MHLKVNVRDLLSGAVLLLIAVLGMYFNHEHPVGTARRMGSGYMPMLAFMGLGGIGLFVMVAALFSGEGSLGRWSKRDVLAMVAAFVVAVAVLLVSPLLSPFFTVSYNAAGLAILLGALTLAASPSLRFIALVSASVAAFGLLLEKAGFFAALTGTMLIACAAERDHFRKPWGIAGLVIFMLALCWWVFIRQLDIRVNLWPTA